MLVRVLHFSPGRCPLGPLDIRDSRCEGALLTAEAEPGGVFT
jgi:hypothetical protein